MKKFILAMLLSLTLSQTTIQATETEKKAGYVESIITWGFNKFVTKNHSQEDLNKTKAVINEFIEGVKTKGFSEALKDIQDNVIPKLKETIFSIKKTSDSLSETSESINKMSKKIDAMTDSMTQAYYMIKFFFVLASACLVLYIIKTARALWKDFFSDEESQRESKTKKLNAKRRKKELLINEE